MKKRIYHIPVFVPHKGCPHDCVFCNQRKITGQTEEMTAKKAEKIIEKNLATIEKSEKEHYTEIAFFGGSFTAIEKEKQIELLSIANKYVQKKRVDAIRCSTRPDCINDEVLEIAKRYNMTSIELGVQSADENVLKQSERGHTFSDVVNASKLIREYGFELGLQMMTGLPGDSREKSIETAEKIAALSPDCVRIYPTLIMENTRLMEMYKSGIYTPQSLEEAVETAADIVPVFENKKIEILRIALQTTDEVNEKNVIGPYHPAFAELVYGRLCKRQIEKFITENAISECGLEITVPNGEISKYIGHKRENKIYFKNKYKIDIKVLAGNVIKPVYKCIII